jgi:hypothetical protein
MRDHSSTVPFGIDRRSLRDRLRSAMDWAGALTTSAPDTAQVRTCLRSDFLARDAIAVFPNGLSTVIGDSERVAFLRLVAARAAILDLRDNDIEFTWQNAEAELTAAQSMLLFKPHESLFDGAATPPTYGFLNANYFPPWDTWLDLVDGAADVYGPILVSWVPRWCRQFVDDGIAVDPAGCLGWGMALDDGIACRGWGKTWLRGSPAT